MSRSTLALALIFLCALGSACSPDLTETDIPEGVTFLDLTGDWLYTATDVRRAGSPAHSPPCRIDGVVLELEKIPRAGAFSGESTGGTLNCSGELAFLSGPLIPYAIRDGYTFNQFVAFDFGSPDWRHDGLVVSADSATIDSMSGSFTLKTEGVVFEGKFSAVRRVAP